MSPSPAGDPGETGPRDGRRGALRGPWTLRRSLAAAAIVLLVVVFITAGVVAALIAGHQLDRGRPTPSPAPTPAPSITAS